jgi:hypothetical protein
MANNKFVYTVSGVELSEAQKTKISHGIAAAVAEALVGENPPELGAEFLSLQRINGGIRATAAVAAKAGGISALADKET